METCQNKEVGAHWVPHVGDLELRIQSYGVLFGGARMHESTIDRSYGGNLLRRRSQVS